MIKVIGRDRKKFIDSIASKITEKKERISKIYGEIEDLKKELFVDSYVCPVCGGLLMSATRRQGRQKNNNRQVCCLMVVDDKSISPGCYRRFFIDENQSGKNISEQEYKKKREYIENRNKERKKSVTLTPQVNEVV